MDVLSLQIDISDLVRKYLKQGADIDEIESEMAQTVEMCCQEIRDGDA